ncbi:MAG: PQQ-like beta-propeller repeat protein [Gemmataceae bacterium]|nr:PQQ-like beta-propeller repeat protein [Gemmataceae bacterium]
MARWLFVCVAVLGALSVQAADWPQWRGPERNDVSKETGLLKAWPKEGPKLLWTFENAGMGFAGPAIVGDRLYTMGGRDAKEFILALDAKTGKELWATEMGKVFVNGWGDGPRGTPTVDGDTIFALGGSGDLLCLNAADGKKRWHINLVADLGGDIPDWGYTESPLVDGDRLVVSPGGAKGTLVALDKNTGKELWRSKGLTDGAAYASIIVAEVGGVRQYVQMTASGVAAVRADTGKFLWNSDLARNDTAICPTPIFDAGHVYVSSGYGAGCGLVKLTAANDKVTAEKVYGNKVMTNHHGGVLLLGGHLYGYSDNKGWTCQEFKTGQSVWAERNKLGKGSLTCADGMLYLYSEGDGTCALVEATPMGWKETGRFRIPRETKLDRKAGQIWTHPVIANGRLYLRDQDLIFCFDVKGVK